MSAYVEGELNQIVEHLEELHDYIQDRGNHPRIIQYIVNAVEFVYGAARIAEEEEV